jgi:hypothetical protein
MKVPHPNDQYADMTVVASCIGNDDSDVNGWFVLILLAPEAPHFHVAEFNLGDGHLVSDMMPCYNIGHAVRTYEALGGHIDSDR